MKTFTKCQLPCGTSASPPRWPHRYRCGRAQLRRRAFRRRHRRHRRRRALRRRAFRRRGAAAATAEPCRAPPRLSPPPSPAPPSPAPRRALRRHPASLPDRCSLPCLATRSTALAADLLKFDKAKRKAAGPNTRRVTCSAPYCHPRHKTTRRAGPQLSVKRQSMAELAGGTTLGLGGAPERPRCVVLQRVNGLVGAPKPQAAGGRY